MTGQILPPTVELGLMVVGSILAALTLMKPLFSWLGLERYQNRVVGGPSSIETTTKNDQWRGYVDELDALGYRPLGVHEERLMPWRKTFLEDVYVAPDQRCFATLYSLFGEDWNVSLTSVMTDHTLVQTSTDDGDDLDTGDCILRRLSGQPLKELTTVHDESIGRCYARGLDLTQHRTMDQSAAAQWQVFHNPTRRGEYCGAMKTLFMAKATTLLCLPLPLMVMWPLFQGHALITEMFLVGAAAWVLAISLFFIGIDLTLKYARNRPQTEDEQGAESVRPASAGGWLIYNPWLWLGSIVAIGWRFGGAASMVQTVLATLAILVAVEFTARLLQLRRRFSPTAGE